MKELERQNEGDLGSVDSFHQMATVVDAGPSRSLEILLGLLLESLGPTHWAICCCFPQAIRRKVGWK